MQKKEKYSFSAEFFAEKNGIFLMDGYFCQKDPHPLKYSVLLRGKAVDAVVEKRAVPELSSYSAAWVEANLHITGNCTKADFPHLFLEIKDTVTGQKWFFRLFSYRNNITNLPLQFSRLIKTAGYLKRRGLKQTLRCIHDFLFAQPPPVNIQKSCFKQPVPSEHLRYLNNRVLIIAEMSIPQCKYYRVQQKADMLELSGIKYDTADWTDRCTCLQLLQFAALVIFYRVPYNETVVEYYREAKRLGIRTGFDIDDLVFDKSEYLKNRNLQSISPADLKNLLSGVDYYRAALEHADFTIASTPVLQEYMKRYNPGKSYVIPNALTGDRGKTEDIGFPLGKRCKVVIGYGSGTSTHDYDFEVCAAALLRILRDYPGTTLVIHGKLQLSDKFKEFQERIYKIDFVPAEDYWNAMKRFDINLIPLEKTVFNNSKSNIKFLEASRLGIPSVASPCVEFKKEIRNGENGFLASNEEQWYDALKQLILSPELRKKVGKRAKKTVLLKYTLKEVFEKSFLPLLHEQSSMGKQHKPKVLVVNILYAPCTFGGATVLTEQMVHAYKKYADPCVFCGYFTSIPHWSGFMQRYSVNDVPVFAYEFPLDGNSPLANYSNIACSNGFSYLLERIRPDIVHFNSIQFLGIEMLQACTELKIPFFVTAHDAWWICERQFMLDGDKHFCGQDKEGIDLYRCMKCTHSDNLFSRWKKLMSALIRAEQVLTPSDYQRNLYIKSGFPAEKIRTNRNGILIPPHVQPHRLHNTLTFAYLGGKCDHKGYFFLKNVMKKVDGKYILKLVDIELKFGSRKIFENEWPVPQQIECCKPFDYQVMDDFYSGIDVLLFPSCWKESFGLTVREALVRNIWVIATDAGGDIARDLHDGENGNLCPMFDEDAFASAIQKQIDHPEMLAGFQNPYRNKIRSVAEQTAEIWEILQTINTKSEEAKAHSFTVFKRKK